MISSLKRFAFGFSCLFLFLALSIASAADTIVPDPIEKKNESPPQGFKEIEAYVAGDVDLTFAEAGGPFVCIGRNKNPKDARQIWSLADQKLLGTIPGKFDVEKPFTLSPDGKFFAAWRGFFNADKVAIFDQKGKPFAELKNQGRISHLEFLADGRLAVFAGETITIWNVPMRKPVGQIRLSGRPNPFQKPVLSPNGKYVLVARGKTIDCQDANGKQVATFNCPKVDDFFESDVAGIAYHPDGKTVAIYLKTIKKQGFALLDVTQGEFKGSFAVDELQGFPPQDARLIDWSTDGQAILLRGRHVVDPESGKVLWSFPEPANATRQAQPSALLFAVNQGIYPAESNLGKLTLKEMSHDRTKIEEMVKAARSGAQITDASLPKLTATTLADVKKAEWPTTVSTWSVKPDPVGDPTKLVATGIPLDVKADQIDQIVFTPPSGRRVFIDLRADGSSPFRALPGQPDKSKSKSVVVYDVVDGLRLNRIDLAFAAKFRSASLDGKLIALSDPENGDRVDVFSADKYEPLCAFRPFQQDGQQNQRVTLLRFVGDGKLLTGNASRLVVWRLPECKAEIQVMVKPYTAALSANAKLLAIGDNDSLRLLDATTLTSLGNLDIPKGDDFTRRELKAIGFHPDGKSLAVLFEGNLTSGASAAFVACWDLETGKPLRSATISGHVATPFQAPSIEFAGNDHFLLNGSELVSAPRRELIWTFQTNFQERHATDSPDGRHWYTARTDLLKDGATLVGVNVLDPKIIEWVKTIDAAPTVLWKAGAQVAVDVQIQGNDRDKAQKSLETTLTNQGMKVVPGAATTLTVSATENATNKTMKFRDFMPGFRKGGGIGDQTVTVVEVKANSKLAVNGTLIWQGNAVFNNTTMGIVHLPADEKDVGAFLNRSMWARVAGWAGSATPPKVIVQTRDGNMCLPGTAALTAKGLEVKPPILSLPK